MKAREVLLAQKKYKTAMKRANVLKAKWLKKYQLWVDSECK